MKSAERGFIAIFVEILLVVAIGVGFIVAVQKSPKKSSSTQPSVPVDVQKPAAITTAPRAELKPETVAQYVITYSDRGFWPSLVSMQPAIRTVLFKNQSSRDLWVLADADTTTGVPAFNQGSFIAPGGEYRIVLPAGAASYRYRNYLDSRHSGTISTR